MASRNTDSEGPEGPSLFLPLATWTRESPSDTKVSLFGVKSGLLPVGKQSQAEVQAAVAQDHIVAGPGLGGIFWQAGHFEHPQEPGVVDIAMDGENI